jgi:hypothetical protein
VLLHIRPPFHALRALHTLLHGRPPRTPLLSNNNPHPLHQPPKHPPIPDTQQQQKSRRHSRPDNAAHALEVLEAVAQGAGGGGDDDARDDDDGGVAEREKGADGDGPLAGGDEAARGEVDGGDVVCVEGVSEAEGAGGVVCC